MNESVRRKFGERVSGEGNWGVGGDGGDVNRHLGRGDGRGWCSSDGKMGMSPLVLYHLEQVYSLE